MLWFYFAYAPIISLSADCMVKKIGKAREWGTVTMGGGGLVSGIYQSIDEAKSWNRFLFYRLEAVRPNGPIAFMKFELFRSAAIVSALRSV
jgi:hypothetical protein